MKMARIVAATILAGAVSACAVTASDGDKVEIEHAADHVWLAQIRADSYCRDFGKRAVLVQSTAAQPSSIALSSRVSTFICSAPAPTTG